MLLYVLNFSEMQVSWAYFSCLCQCTCKYNGWLLEWEEKKSCGTMIDRNASKAFGMETKDKCFCWGLGKGEVLTWVECYH